MEAEGEWTDGKGGKEGGKETGREEGKRMRSGGRRKDEGVGREEREDRRWKARRVSGVWGG